MQQDLAARQVASQARVVQRGETVDVHGFGVVPHAEQLLAAFLRPNACCAVQGDATLRVPSLNVSLQAKQHRV